MKIEKGDFATVRYTGAPGEEYQAVIERPPVDTDDYWRVVVEGRESNAFATAQSAAIKLAEKYEVPYKTPTF